MLSLSFSKLVSTPTETVWSQVYNAGNLFATLSLIKSEESEEQLSAIGKSLFSNLEAEFFTLDKKDLAGIKEAISKTLNEVPEKIIVNFCCGFFKENILYIYIAGKGKIIMRRGGNTGVLLENKIGEKQLISASGILKNNDLVVIQTAKFAEDISSESFSDALDLDLPNDIAEALSPSMHEKVDGEQAAIIIKYKEPETTTNIPTDEDSFGAATSESTISDDREEKAESSPPSESHTTHSLDIDQDQKKDDKMDKIHEEAPNTPEIHHYSENLNPKKSFFGKINTLFSMLKIKRFTSMNHKRKLFLTVAFILFIVLASSVILARQRQENQRMQTLFESIYDPALEDYESGKDIQKINEAFARDEFISARDKLKEGEGKFKEGSDEENQITELLKKVESELGMGDDIKKIEAKEVELEQDSLLGATKDNKNAIGLTKDDAAVFLLRNNAILNIENDDEIISNDDDWTKPVSLSTYQGNFYILDQSEGIIKYTAGADGFGQTSYFKTKPPNINDAISMAIDGSVWILFKDGSIGQYTSGESDGYNINGLATPFNKATMIFTNLNTESVYILDNGNSRIVRIDKDGNFEEQYVADIIKSAKAFEVRESENRILLLADDKFWEITL